MSLNLEALGVENEYSIYVPTSYLDYKYAINITPNYVDLLNVSSLSSDTDYTYIRVFFERPRTYSRKYY